MPLIVKDHFARPFGSFPGGLVTPGLCGKTGWRHADPRTQAFSGDVTARSPTKNKWVKQRTTASMQRGQPVHQQFRGWNATRALYRKFLAISAWLRFSVRRSSQPFSANTKREPEQHAARPRSIASTVQHRFRGTAPLGSRRSLLSANSPRVRRWSPQPFSPIKDAARPAHGTSTQYRQHRFCGAAAARLSEIAHVDELSRCRRHNSRDHPEAAAVVPLIVKDHFARPFCNRSGMSCTTRPR